MYVILAFRNASHLFLSDVLRFVDDSVSKFSKDSNVSGVPDPFLDILKLSAPTSALLPEPFLEVSLLLLFAPSLIFFWGIF